MKKIITFFLLFFCITLPVFAENSADYSVGMSQKLGRGLWNALSSPAEIPCTMRDDISQNGGVGIVTGLFKGIGFFARRLLVGVDEFATFMIPMEPTLAPVCTKKPAPAIQN